jgi:hypothetical protein
MVLTEALAGKSLIGIAELFATVTVCVIEDPSDVTSTQRARTHPRTALKARRCVWQSRWS